MCAEFIKDYIRTHSEKSPSLPLLFVEQPQEDLFELYKAEFPAPEEQVARHTFFKMWYRTLKEKVVDPCKNVLLEVKIRKRRAVGFKACDTCEHLKLMVRLAKSKTEREIAEGNKIDHFRSVRRDRDELARIMTLCRLNDKIVGFAIDAADVGKWQTPTTKSRAKV